MRRAYLLILTAVLAVAMSASGRRGSAQAAGPFDLFSRHGGCDSSCCDATPCGQDECCAAECDSDCGGNCDSPACDTCCDSRSHKGCSLGDLLGSCGSRGCNRCPDPCSYWSVFGGWNILNDYNGEAEVPGPPPRLRGTFSDGWAIGFAKGRRFNRALRGELEFALRSNTANQWSVNGVTGDWSGHLFGYSAMANLYHDFKSWELVGIAPYVGAGIGLAIVDGDFRNSLTRFEVEDAAFAYQFIVGGSKKLNRNVELFAEYRYFGTTGLDLVNAGVAPNVQLGTHEAEVDNALFGLRISR